MKSLKKLVLAVTGALAVAVSAAGMAHAGPVYSVNSTIGIGSVVGSIETDGTLGLLQTANILDWTLAINDGTGSFTLLGPLSGNNSTMVVAGSPSPFTASLTDLLFNFSASFADVLFQNPHVGSGGSYWCLEGSNFGCSGVAGESVFVSPDEEVTRVDRSGIVSVATAVPLPAALPLFASGLAGLGWLSRRRRKQSV